MGVRASRRQWRDVSPAEGSGGRSFLYRAGREGRVVVGEETDGTLTKTKKGGCREGCWMSQDVLRGPSQLTEQKELTFETLSCPVTNTG